MFEKLVRFPAEFASAFGLVLLSLMVPFMVVNSLPGAFDGDIHHQWVFTAIAGFSVCAGIVQAGALWQAGTWPGVRLWSCRLSMVASLGFVFAFVPIRFYGAGVAGTILLVINWFSTVSWESKRLYLVGKT